MSTVVVTRGQKKTSEATCKCKRTGEFEVRVNKVPLDLLEDSLFKAKLYEIIYLLGEETLNGLDFNITCLKGSGYTGRIYAARQAFCRAVIAYFSNCSDEVKKEELKKTLMHFDRFTIITDTRKKEPKKYGGPGARARYQKSYR